MYFEEFFLEEINEPLRTGRLVKREFYSGDLRIWIFHGPEYEITRIVFYSFLGSGIHTEYSAGTAGVSYRIIPEEEPEGITVFQARLGSQVTVPFDPKELHSLILGIENPTLKEILVGLPERGLGTGVFLPKPYIDSLLAYKASKPFREYSGRIKDPNEASPKKSSGAKKERKEKEAGEPEKSEDALEKARKLFEEEVVAEVLKKEAPPDPDSFEEKVRRAKELREKTERIRKMSRRFNS